MNYISFLKKNLPKKLYFKLNTIRLYYLNRSFKNLSNKDKIKGPLSRSYNFSAVEIDKPPFNFVFKTKEEILTIEREGIGYLRTFLYKR